ncbi:MAG TPA: DivIVA domain-containing protein [Longimicrobiales bacterium]|nr:DivIVA domain-containing protein [Longimicrobiales bacterium]
MIDLTPLDVRKKKGDFRRAMRGYEPALVDDFLDLAADRLEELVRHAMALEEKVERLERAEKEHNEREKALTEALVTAQEMRAEVRNQALREAELARKEAEQDARRIRAEALEAKEREKEGIRRLQARRAQLVRSYRLFLEREVAELQVMSHSLEGEEDQEPGEPESRSRGVGVRADPPKESSASGAGEAKPSEVESRGAAAPGAAAGDTPWWEAPSSSGSAGGPVREGPSSFTDEEEDALVREMNAILAKQGKAPPESGSEDASQGPEEVELFLSDDDVVGADSAFLEEDGEPESESPLGLTLRPGEAERPEPEEPRRERQDRDDDSDDLLTRMFEH